MEFGSTSVANGSYGGGSVRLAVAGTLTVDGSISSGGRVGAAGGSVFLSAATLAGSGSIRANGGDAMNGSSGGGGGGRVALLADTLSFSGELAAIGGNGSQAGGAGTVFTRVTAEPNGRLSIDNAGRSGYTRFAAANWPTGQVCALRLAGAAIMVPAMTLTLTQLDITTGAMLTHEHLGGQPLRIYVSGAALVGAGSSINVDGAGYYSVAWWQNDRGPGVGGISGWNGAGGAGYGGQGGAGIPGGGGGATYGSYQEPVDFGSTSLANGSYGGGSVRLAVGGSLTVDGSISADGQGPGAAGGSVYLACAEFAGTGNIEAKGTGGYYAGSDGDGGGGRIAVHAETTSFVGTNSVAGGTGGFAGGGAGTICLTNSTVLCGSVRDAAGQGVAGATLSATGGYVTLTDAQGNYMLLIPSNWSGAVNVSASDRILTPVSHAFSGVVTPLFGGDFSAAALRQPILTSQLSGNTLRLAWDSQSGVLYQVYSAPDLIHWSAYGLPQPGTGAPISMDCPMAGATSLFFRVGFSVSP